MYAVGNKIKMQQLISFSFNPFRSTVKIIPSQLERKPKNAIQDKSPPEKDWELVPPDGGWGWLILAGEFNRFSYARVYVYVAVSFGFRFDAC